MKESLRTALSGNRQFVAFWLAVLLAVAAFAGSPGRILLVGDSARPSPPTTQTPPASPTDTTIGAARPGSSPVAPDTTPPTVDAPRRTGDVDPPGQGDPEPEPSCQTDALFATVHGLRAAASDTLGVLYDQLLPGEDPERGHVAGESLERLARLVTGCAAEPFPEDPDAMQQYMSGLVVEALLDIVGTVPDLGIDPISLPPGVFDLTGLLSNALTGARDSLPVGLADLLGPYASDVREYCGTAELLVLLAPILVADSVPIDGDDLTRLVAPLSGLCSLFDDDSFLEDRR